MPFAAAAFRHLVGGFPAGVTIVTTNDEAGAPHGFTASSFTSVSLAPPLVLVCLDVGADCYPAFSTAKAMAINILAVDQSELAIRFATRGADKFAALAHRGGAMTGSPLVDGATTHIECTMHARQTMGDHVLLIGEVVGGERTDREPMLHFNRKFGRFA
jgi:flavin reductase ActVB